MKKPTEEQYHDSCKNIVSLKDWILHNRRQIDELLDKICDCKERIKVYEKNLKKHEEIVKLYEAYEEYEKENKVKENEQ